MALLQLSWAHPHPSLINQEDVPQVCPQDSWVGRFSQLKILLSE